LQADNTLQLVKKYCQPLLDEGADTIVLGCTHYPFVRPLIEQVVGEHVSLIDTGAAVAKQLQKRLAALDLLSSERQVGSVRFWTNSAAENAKQVVESLWKQSAEVSLL
jgi:glutamate racemase